MDLVGDGCHLSEARVCYTLVEHHLPSRQQAFVYAQAKLFTRMPSALTSQKILSISFFFLSLPLSPLSLSPLSLSLSLSLLSLSLSLSLPRALCWSNNVPTCSLRRWSMPAIFSSLLLSCLSRTPAAVFYVLSLLIFFYLKNIRIVPIGYFVPKLGKSGLNAQCKRLIRIFLK